MTQSPYEIINAESPPHFLLLCDHASAYVPPAYAGLGLAPDTFERHIAWDIGAAKVTRALAHKLNAPAILSNFSRLLIDPNRGLDDPTLVMKLSDGAIIPANRAVDPYQNKTAWQERIAAFYTPYHQAIEACLLRAEKQGAVPIILSIHSFTPNWKGGQRPMQAAVLWDKDERLPTHLFTHLAAEMSPLGDNEPYSGRLKNDTLYRHGTLRGLPHALIEMRQDQLQTDKDCAIWAARLVPAMLAAAQDAHCRRVNFYGSHTDEADAIGG